MLQEEDLTGLLICVHLVIPDARAGTQFSLSAAFDPLGLLILLFLNMSARMN
jgi:hypothetical protein